MNQYVVDKDGGNEDTFKNRHFYVSCLSLEGHRNLQELDVSNVSNGIQEKNVQWMVKERTVINCRNQGHEQ